MSAVGNAEFAQPDCWRCAAELADSLSDPIEAALTVGGRMFLCPTCGNKRCPKATDHRLGCTDSNEPGQVGSRYGTLLFGRSVRSEPTESNSTTPGPDHG